MAGIQIAATCFANHSMAAAICAPAVRTVEGEEAGVEDIEAARTSWAGALGAEYFRQVGGIHDPQHAFAKLQGSRDELFDFTGLAGGVNFADDEINVVFLEAYESGELRGLHDAAIDVKFIASLPGGQRGDLVVEAFAAPDHGGHDAERLVRRGRGHETCAGLAWCSSRDLALYVGQEPLADGDGDAAGALFLHRHLALRAELRSHLAEEQAQKMIDFRDGGHGGFHTAAGDALLDGDGGRQAGNVIDIGALHLFHELSRVSGHAVEEAPLAFGKDEIESERGFSGAAQSRHDHKLISRDGDINVLQIVFAGTMNLNGVGGRHGIFNPDGCGQGSEIFLSFQETARVTGRAFCDVFRRSGDDQSPTIGSRFRSEIDHPIRGPDDFQIMFDDEQTVALIHQFLKDFEENGDVIEMQAGGGFVENEQGFFTRAESFAFQHVTDQLKPLTFAATERVDGLAKFQIPEPHRSKPAEEGGHCGNFGFSGMIFKKRDRFCDREIEDIGDAQSIAADAQRGGGVAAAIALRALHVEIAEKLHFHLFESRAHAALAAAGTRVETEISRGEFIGFGVRGFGENLADDFKGPEIDGGSAAWGAAEWILIHHDQLAEVFCTLNFLAISGLHLAGPSLESEEIFIEHLVDERAFATA